jgi:hypothetical protein
MGISFYPNYQQSRNTENKALLPPSVLALLPPALP